MNLATKNRLEKLYKGRITVPVINCWPGRTVHDLCGSLCQGGIARMEWFVFGIDPLLLFLDLKLTGIPRSSLPVLGPAEEVDLHPLPHFEERFKAMVYCNEVKPAICSIE